MMVVTFYDELGGIGERNMHFPFQRSVHRGFLNNISEGMFSVISVYADGDELDYIKDEIRGIPTAGSCCTWRGDFAAFICDNIPLHAD